MYTAQRNSNGNIIVCKGNLPRNSYAIIFTGSYPECMRIKFSPYTTFDDGALTHVEPGSLNA